VQIEFDLAPVGICVLRNRIIQRCNREFAAMFGYAPEDLAGRSTELLYPSHDEFVRTGARAEPVMRSCDYSDERIMRRRDGTLFWCRVTGRPADPRKPFAHAVFVFEDLSRVRRVAVKLTAREREVAALVAGGRSSKQIAESLGIGRRTVEAYRARLMQKLGARSSGELISRLLGMSNVS
jgi:PAS domain S-box-containing protein